MKRRAHSATDTVAAGGGSRLFYRNAAFVVGPESAGASPGPACYRKDGPLAVTDANLILGRLIPESFPRIFGKNEDEALDPESSRKAFKTLAEEINSYYDKTITKKDINVMARGIRNKQIRNKNIKC